MSDQITYQQARKYLLALMSANLINTIDAMEYAVRLNCPIHKDSVRKHIKNLYIKRIGVR